MIYGELNVVLTDLSLGSAIELGGNILYGELSATLADSSLGSTVEPSGNILYSVLGDASITSNGVVLVLGGSTAVLDDITPTATGLIPSNGSLLSTLDSITSRNFGIIYDGTTAPYEDIVSWTGHPLTGSLVRVRIGNLVGMFGQPNEFGLFAGEGWDASSGAVPLASSKYIRLGSFANEFHNVPINLYDNGVITMQMEPDTPSFAMGNPIPSGYATGAGLWQGKDTDDIYKWRIGDPSTVGSMLSWSGSALSIVNGSLDISGANAHLAFGDPVPTSPTSGTGIWIDKNGLYGINDGVLQIFIDTLDGRLYIDGGTEFGVSPILGYLYIEGVLTLGTDGRLQQGTGTWGTNFTGSAIWNESGIMNIGGWKNNVKQWWGGTDGKLYAGGGGTVIDANGITLNSTANYLDPGVALIYRNSGRELYRIAGQNNYQIYHLMTAPVGFGYPLEHRNWINNLNPGALYDLFVTDGNSTYKYGSSRLNIDHRSTNVKSLELSMKHYDNVTGNRAEGKLYYYSKLGERYNTVTLTSECQDQTKGIKTASILLRSASGSAEVSSKIDMEADSVNVKNGVVTYSGGHPEYRGVVYASVGEANVWKRVALVTIGTGTYAGASFKVEYIVGTSNWGQYQPITRKYDIRMVRSSSVENDIDAAYIEGNDSTHLRVVKTATGVFEIQVKSGYQYSRNQVTITNITNSYGTFDFGVATAGSGTIYTPKWNQANRVVTLDTPTNPYTNKQFNVNTTTTYDANSYGVPITAKAIYIRTHSVWQTASSNNFLTFEKYGTSDVWLVARACVSGIGTDATGWVALDDNGRFNVKCVGASTLDYCGAVILAYME